MFGVALSSIGQKPIFLWVAYNILVNFDQKTLCHMRSIKPFTVWVCSSVVRLFIEIHAYYCTLLKSYHYRYINAGCT